MLESRWLLKGSRVTAICYNGKTFLPFTFNRHQIIFLFWILFPLSLKGTYKKGGFLIPCSNLASWDFLSLFCWIIITKVEQLVCLKQITTSVSSWWELLSGLFLCTQWFVGTVESKKQSWKIWEVNYFLLHNKKSYSLPCLRETYKNGFDRLGNRMMLLLWRRKMNWARAVKIASLIHLDLTLNQYLSFSYQITSYVGYVCKINSSGLQLHFQISSHVLYLSSSGYIVNRKFNRRAR